MNPLMKITNSLGKPFQNHHYLAHSKLSPTTHRWRMLKLMLQNNRLVYHDQMQQTSSSNWYFFSHHINTERQDRWCDTNTDHTARSRNFLFSFDDCGMIEWSNVKDLNYKDLNYYTGLELTAEELLIQQNNILIWNMNFSIRHLLRGWWITSLNVKNHGDRMLASFYSPRLSYTMKGSSYQLTWNIHV